MSKVYATAMVAGDPEQWMVTPVIGLSPTAK
jgi:hypothetical protein